MKKVPVEPSNFYNEQIFSIDEQICALLKQRKELSNNNPGIPTSEYISSWMEKYGLYEDLLTSLFQLLRNEEFFRPQVEPNNFRRHLPVMKTMEEAGRLYSVTFIRQFENASVVHLDIDWDDTNVSNSVEELHRRHSEGVFHLFIREDYDCRPIGGSGSGGHFTQKFVVSPPLPDDVKELSLVFKEYNNHFKDKPTGLEFIIDL